MPRPSSASGDSRSASALVNASRASSHAPRVSASSPATQSSGLSLILWTLEARLAPTRWHLGTTGTNPLAPWHPRHLVLVLGENPLNLVAAVGLSKSEHQEHARLDRHVILAGDRETPSDQGGFRYRIGRWILIGTRWRDSPGSCPRRRDDEDALLRCVRESFVLRAAGRPGASSRHDQTLGPGVHGGFDQIASRALIDQDDIDTRQGREASDVELHTRV